MRDQRQAHVRERAVAELAARQHGLVTSGQLLAIGLSRDGIMRRAAAGRLHRQHRAVWAVGHPGLSPAGRRLAAVLALGELAIASHLTAAAIWGLRPAPSGPVHVTVPGHGASRPGIRVHHRALAQADRAIRDRTPVTSLARTLVDLGDVVSSIQLRNAFVRAEQLRLIDMVAIDAALERAGRTRGALRLCELLRVYDSRWVETRSPLELALIAVVVAYALPEPEINAWIEDRFLVDALWRECRLVVEVDGAEVHGTATARRDDARRDRALRARGYAVVRLPYTIVVRRPEQAANAIRAALGRGFVADSATNPRTERSFSR